MKKPSKVQDAAASPPASKPEAPPEPGDQAAAAKGTSAKRAKALSRKPAATAPGPKMSKSKRSAGRAAAKTGISAEVRMALIAETAYYRAERRAFAPGGQLQDWIEAESEIDERLRNAGIECSQ